MLNNKKLLIYIYILVGISIAFLSMEINRITSIVFIGTILASLFLSCENIIIIMAAVIPLANVFKLGDYFTVLPFLYLIYLIKYFFEVKFKIEHINKTSVILLLCFCFINIFVSVFYYGDILNIISPLLHLIFIYLASKYHKQNTRTTS